MKGNPQRWRLLFIASISSIVVAALLPVVGFAPVEAGVSGPVRVSPSGSASYTETAVVSDPTNSSNLFAGSNRTGACNSTPQPVQGYKSSNAGASWPSDNPPPRLNNKDNAIDPAPAYDASGALYYAYVDQQCGSGAAPALVVTKSTNKGSTWVAPGSSGNPEVIETSANNPDKPMLVADTISGSPFRDRLYAVYSRKGNPQPLEVAYSSDHAATWTRVQVDNVGNDTGGSLAVGSIPNSGTLYATWWDYLNRLIAGAYSTNGGVSFIRLSGLPATNVGSGGYEPANYAQNHPIYPNTSLDTDRSSSGSSSHPGYVYLVWNDTDADGKLHIFFARSRDGGQTWNPSRLRIDTGNTNDAWQPTIAVDQSSGLLTLAWYDRRNDASNHLYRVYYTQSADGGSTFLSQQLPVSTCSADPTVDANGTGDYMGIAAASGASHPVWVENQSLSCTSTAFMQVRAASITAPTPGRPTNVVATAGTNQATVTWQAPTNGGDSTISGYIATAYLGTSAKNSVAVNAAMLSATLYGLQGANAYSIQVRAVNAQGIGGAGISNIVSPTGSSSTYAATVLGSAVGDPTPVLYYRLGDPSGTITPDSSGTGNNGTYYGGYTLNQPGALLNDPDGAVLFDGSTGYARTANSQSLSITGALTVEAWAKWTAPASNPQNVINKGDGVTLPGTSYHLAFVGGCSGCGMGFYTFIGNQYYCACQASALPAGQWFYLVGTRSAAGQISFYVNGSLVATGSDPGGPLNNVSSGVGVGASGSGTGPNLNSVNGVIDEAAIYPAVLTATQISNHFHAAGY